MELNQIPYEVFHRNIKYPRIELRTGRLHFILPSGQTEETLFEKHRDWITGKMRLIDDALKKSCRKDLVMRSEREFKDLVQNLTEKSATILEIKVNKIMIRKMRSKWASLSGRRNLTVNILLKNLPHNLIDYVIYHEVSHSFQKRHNIQFWDIVSRRFPDYGDLEKDLFRFWFIVAARESLTNPGSSHHKTS